MRLRKADIQGRVNADLSFEFTENGLTSYAGLELLIRYFRRIGLNGLIRHHLIKALPPETSGRLLWSGWFWDYSSWVPDVSDTLASLKVILCFTGSAVLRICRPTDP